MARHEDVGVSRPHEDVERSTREALAGEVVFASAEEQAQRSAELLGAGALLVMVPPPASEVRGRLGEMLEELVERELARLGAPSPYLTAWSAMPEDAQDRLADQLFRARTVGARGLAIAMGSLRAIATPALTPDDSATLRWLALTTEQAPLVVLIDDADVGIAAFAAPLPLETLLHDVQCPIARAARDRAARALDDAFRERTSSWPPPDPALYDVTVNDTLVAPVDDTTTGPPAVVPSPIPDSATETPPRVAAATPSAAAAIGPSTADVAPSTAAAPATDVAVPTAAAPAAVGASPAAARAPTSSDASSGTPRSNDASTSASPERRPGDASLLADAGPTRATRSEGVGARSSGEHETAARAERADAKRERRPRSVDASERAKGPGAEARRQDEVRGGDEPRRRDETREGDEGRARQALRGRDEARATEDRRPAEQRVGREPGRGREDGRGRAQEEVPDAWGSANAWRSWAMAIAGTRGAQPLAAFERLFVESYVPLANAIAGGLDDPRALRAYDDFRRSFERSYSDAFATFGVTNRRPKLVMDAYELAAKQARLANARATHVLIVDSMRFDLGCAIRDALTREVSGAATLTSEILLWASLPTTTMRQLETFARGLDALRAPAQEEPSESLRGRAAEVVRRLRIGSRELYKLDLVPAMLESSPLPRIAEAAAEALARHLSTLAPRTLVFIVGDHGFDIARRGEIRTGGASPEEVLVPAFTYLVGDLH